MFFPNPVNLWESNSRGEQSLSKINNFSVPTGAEWPHPGLAGVMKSPAWPSPSLAAILHFNSSRTTVRTKRPKKSPLSLLVKAQQFSSNYLCHSGWKKKNMPFLTNAEGEKKVVSGQGTAPVLLSPHRYQHPLRLRRPQSQDLLGSRQQPRWHNHGETQAGGGQVK